MLKWLGWGAASLIGLCVAALLIQIPGFLSWRRDIEQRLLANSAVINTPKGPLEYGESGRGAPVLMLHGTPGGYDQILSMVRATAATDARIRVIAPSRPGYLGTPLASGRTPAEQARLYAALLDHLGIDKVVVLGVSGGGPSALQFAVLYPDRCSALILEEAATRSIKAGKMTMPPPLVDFLIYLFRGKAIADLQAKNPGDPAMSRVAAAVIDTLAPIGRRVAGNENDRLQFARMENWPLNRIRCPTLILHGSDDKDVPLADAQYAHERIPGSQLVILPGADHAMVALRYKELNALIAAFVHRHRQAEASTPGTETTVPMLGNVGNAIPPMDGD